MSDKNSAAAAGGGSFVVIEGAKVFVGSDSTTNSSGTSSNTHQQLRIDVATVDDSISGYGAMALALKKNEGGEQKEVRLPALDGASSTAPRAALFFCSACDVQFTDSNAALAHKASKKHRQRAGGLGTSSFSLLLGQKSSSLLALVGSKKSDADVTVEDLRTLFRLKKEEKGVLSLQELRPAAGGKRSRSR